jgi:hypothetical protein
MHGRSSQDTGWASRHDKDAARLVPPDARRTRTQKPEEAGTTRTQTFKGDGELIEIDRALATRGWMEACRVELASGAARGELVASDAREVSGVDEQLALRDAHRQDVCHVVIRDGTPVTCPVDKAVGTTDAIDDARGIVRVARQRYQLGLLLGEALETGVAVTASRIDDPIEPGGELGAPVVEVTERAAIEERALEIPECPLDAGLGVGIAAHRAWPKLIMSRECQKPWIVDRLCAFPAQHDGLLAVVRAAMGACPEARSPCDLQ